MNKLNEKTEKEKKNFKSGFIAVVGRTNVGKSTFVNSLVEEKVSIITSKSQTTRFSIKAIVNRPNSQIIFIDTPGIHKPKNKLGENMVNISWEVLKDSDLIIFIIEATSNIIGKGDLIILEKIKKTNKKTILIINKIDKEKKEKLLKLIDIYSKEYNFEEIFLIQSTKNNKKEEILNKIESYLPLGPKFYDTEEYTDQTIRQIVEEIIREKALKLLDQEVPHGIYVNIEKMKLRKTSNQKDIYDIDAIIYCIKDTHKGIIIGKEGKMLKKIGTYARQDIEKLTNTKINLKIWVKVNKNWQDNINTIKKHIIKND